MYLETRLLFLYVETPLHAGAGAGVEAIDLPIQRERTTGYPIVQAPGIKGALRSEAREGQGKEVDLIFGPDAGGDGNDPRHAGAFSPSDARILLFPVRSLKGVFSWTTSVDVLHRWMREAKVAQMNNLPEIPAEPEPEHCYTSGQGVTIDNNVVLEEFPFKTTNNEKTKGIASWLADNALPEGSTYDWWREQLKEKLVILRNDDFRDFVQYATQVLTRIRLNADNKTVVNGALWTEEHLPPDTLMFVPTRATRFRADELPKKWQGQNPTMQAKTILDWVANKQNIAHRLQIGGDETVGRGVVSLRWQKRGAS